MGTGEEDGVLTTKNTGAKITNAPPPPAGTTPPPSLDDNLSIYTALREQLGLELKATTGAIDVIVIDSVSAPTPD